MARRKNTAECREVLRKVFEQEEAAHGGEGAAARQPERRQRPQAGASRIAGQGAASCEPLLGQQQASEAAPFDRHAAIRSSAPGAGCEDRGGGFTGRADHPGADHFAANVSDYAEEPMTVGPEVPGAEAACQGAGGEQESAEGETRAEMARREDPMVQEEQVREQEPFQEQEPTGEPSQAEVPEPMQEAGGGEPAAGSLSRLRSWILRDDSRGVFGKPVEARASTLVIVGLSVAIVVGLLGIYFKIEPQEGRLAGRILDDREAATGAPAAGVGKPPVRTSANIPGRGLSALARPVWSRQGGQRPPLRNVTPVATAQPATGQLTGQPAGQAAAFVTTEATRWLRVRDLMGKEECAKLLDHLKKLQKELKERSGCDDNTIACKELKSRMRKRHGEDLYAVDIGPFASWSLAQQASAELKHMTRRAPWVFRDKPEYFSESYPRKP